MSNNWNKYVVTCSVYRNYAAIELQLEARGVPGYILRILIYCCCKNQDMCIRWDDAYSAKFKVTHGLDNEGIIPLPFQCICR